MAAAPLFIRPGRDRTREMVVLTLLVSLVAKVMGFVRVQQIAALLGATIYADALLLTFQLIWLLETVLVAGAVVPAFVARIYRVEADETADSAARFFLHAALWATSATAVYGVGLWLFADQVIALAAPGFDSQARDLFRDLLALSVLAPLFLTLSEFSSLVNRLTGNGVWYSVPQLVTNLTALAGLVLGFRWHGPTGAAQGMIVGLSVGTIAVVGLQVAVMPRDAVSTLWTCLKRNLWRPVTLPYAKAYWGAVFALVLSVLVGELYVYIDFYFASTIRPGGIGLISYASRLANLTNMLIVSTAFIILEPRWARALAEDGSGAWRQAIAPDAAALLSLLAAPVAVLIFFAPQATALIYQSGSMPPADAAALNQLTQIYGFSVLAISAALVLARVLVLHRQTRWIVATSLAVLPIKIALSLALAPRFGLNGLAWATIGGLTLQVAAYALILARSGLGFSASGVAPRALRLIAVFAAVFAAAGSLTALGLTQPVLVVAAWGGIALMNIAVGVALGFAYSGPVRSLLSPAGWRSRLAKLLGRH